VSARRLLVAGLLSAALGGCHGHGPESAPESSTTPLSAPSAATGVDAPARRSRSIYALPMTLTDQSGATSGLDVFRGRPVLVGMFYGTCPSACPVLVSTIKRVMTGLDGEAGAELRVLLVSFDPDRDTPAALAKIAAERGLDGRWKLASAPEDQVRDLAALLGIQYRKLPDGNFSHTSSIVLLDRSGVIDLRVDDMAQPIDPLVSRARMLGAGR
jgi:protein SCO1/2